MKLAKKNRNQKVECHNKIEYTFYTYGSYQEKLLCEIWMKAHIVLHFYFFNSMPQNDWHYKFIGILFNDISEMWQYLV